MAFQTYKKQLIYSIQPLTTFQQSKKLNIEVEILTMIYYLKIEHINFFYSINQVYNDLLFHTMRVSYQSLLCFFWNYFLSVQAYRGAGVGTLMSGESSCSCGVAGLGCQALILSVSCW